MLFYHGSVVGELNQLLPSVSWYSNLKEPRVYLTTNRQLALHYIWDIERIGVKMPMLRIGDDGVLTFQEMFSGALEYFYKGVSGYIYHCEGDFVLDPSSGVPTCATSAQPVPVCHCEYIPDVYEEIISYTDKGTFVYERYETLSETRRDIIRGHVMRFIKRNNLIHDTTHPGRHFVEEKFPQYWAEANVLSEHGRF